MRRREFLIPLFAAGTVAKLGYSREEMDDYIRRNAVPLGASPGCTDP